jgi:hypothetical protein
VTFSNSLAFELCFRWAGLLIEANPLNYEALVAAPRTPLTPPVARQHSAVCAAGGSAVVRGKGGHGIAGLESYVTVMNATAADADAWAGVTDAQSEAPCSSLRSLMGGVRIAHDGIA